MYSFEIPHRDFERLLETAPLSDEEKQIAIMKRKGYSNIQVCMALNISERTLSRRIHKIAVKFAKEYL